MNEIMEQYLDKMLRFEEEGYLEEALTLGEKLIEEFAEDAEAAETIFLEKGKMEFRAQLDRDALFDLIRAYNIWKNEEIYELILEAYLAPNRNDLLLQYQKNREELETYPYYRAECTSKEAAAFPLWKDEKFLVYVDTQRKEFEICERTEYDQMPNPGQHIGVEGEMWLDTIQILERACCRKDVSTNWNSNEALELIWDEPEWIVFLQLYDIEELLDLRRCVFLIDEWGVRKWFYESQVVPPEKMYFNRHDAKYKAEIDAVREEWYVRDKKNIKTIQEYYPAAQEEILERIRGGKPRILFWSCRFTTAVQYRIRDVMTAAQHIGCDTELLIEKSDMHKICIKDVREKFASFKPDIVFIANYFRENYSEYLIPQEVVWITWIQDNLSQSTRDQAIVNNLGKRDIVVSMFISDLQGKHWNMNYKDVLKAPLSVDQNIYKKYELTEKERAQYACDICYVANASDYKKVVDDYKTYFPEEIQKDFQMVIDVYFQLMEDGMFFYGYEDNLNILGYIVKELHLKWAPLIVMKTAEMVADMLSYSRYKSLIVEWLLEAGFTNIKLYGNGWENNEKFSPYAMGPIENGEQLSKALQAAKIALGAHLSISLPGRVSEITASGAFCLVNDIPKADLGNAREYFEEDVELVYFYNKQDLIEKTGYYLTHETERKKIAEAGWQKLQKEVTYENILERLFGEIDQLLKKRGV